MIGLLKIVPVWIWAVTLAVTGLGSALMYQSLMLNALRAEHAQYVVGVEQRARDASEAARAVEQRRQREIDEVRNHAQDQIRLATADAAVAASAADSLQQQIDRLLAGRAACNTRVTQGSAAVRDLTDMLADLRRRADERAGELAQIADASRIAGQACEKAYDALGAPGGAQKLERQSQPRGTDLPALRF